MLDGLVRIVGGAIDHQQMVEAAGRGGKLCGQCGRGLGNEETVWRVPLRVESEWSLSPYLLIAPVCETCRPWPMAGGTPRSCSGCGRGVVSDKDDYWPWPGHVFCSDHCAASWWDEQRLRPVDLPMNAASMRNAEGECPACGQTVLGRRTTCGVACRQRLYRLRKRGAADTAHTSSFSAA